MEDNAIGKVIAVCVSEQKGTQKKNVGTAQFVEDWGIQGDAHAGKWHRQVSLLSHEQVVGMHDLVIHDYGPGRRMCSFHAEVPE